MLYKILGNISIFVGVGIALNAILMLVKCWNSEALGFAMLNALMSLSAMAWLIAAGIIIKSDKKYHRSMGLGMILGPLVIFIFCKYFIAAG